MPTFSRITSVSRGGFLSGISVLQDSVSRCFAFLVQFGVFSNISIASPASHFQYSTFQLFGLAPNRAVACLRIVGFQPQCLKFNPQSVAFDTNCVKNCALSGGFICSIPNNDQRDNYTCE